MKQFFLKLKKAFQKHPVHYSLLIILLAGAFFVRVYRTDKLLYFFYDQGRDALAIKKIYAQLDPALVGPTTGLAGILRGPAFYYLLLPAYLVGKGSPIVAAIWLQIINMFGLVFIYLSAKKISSKRAGLLAVLLVGFSRHLVGLSRWLSNPSPIFTSVPIMLYGLLQIKDNKKPHIWWPIVALMVGLNLQFEIASEIWFIPAILLLLLINSSIRPTKKTALVSSGVFFATLLPQIVFDLVHDGIMRKAVIKHFADSQQASFAFAWSKIIERLGFYFQSFQNIYTPRHAKSLTLFLVFVFFYLLRKKNRKRVSLLTTLIFVPLLILLFYQGNQGNFYSYYLMGLFPLSAILIAVVLDKLLSNKFLLLVPLLFLTTFIYPNYINLKNYLIAGVDGETHISLGNQIQAIDWIYQDAEDKKFNLDVYVPPVLPHSYDYLFEWYGQKEYQKLPSKEQIPLLYTLYEVDTQHPQRLEKWLQRQQSIAKVEDQARFGGIVVQRRTRK